MKREDARQAARWLSYARIGLGVAAIVAPTLPARPWIGDDAGFLAATPGDDAGNKTNVVRVLTLTRENAFGPRPFTLCMMVG